MTPLKWEEGEAGEEQAVLLRNRFGTMCDGYRAYHDEHEGWRAYYLRKREDSTTAEYVDLGRFGDYFDSRTQALAACQAHHEQRDRTALRRIECLDWAIAHLQDTTDPEGEGALRDLIAFRDQLRKDRGPEK
jgi:hypothetical protein